jgi:rhodanese-related sulfurtransferase
MSERIPSISPAHLHGRMRAGQPVVLLDVRSPAEYRAGHVQGALSVPLDELDATDLAQRTGVADIGSATPLYLTCQSGLRAQQAAERLHLAGHRNLMLLQGGTEAWARAGLPLRGSAKALSLEQQVQITIGALLILKVVFGFTVHELFFVLGALLGAGLITAGITRWCGLARLLARMPWNRERNPGDQAAT